MSFTSQLQAFTVTVQRRITERTTFTVYASNIDDANELAGDQLAKADWDDADLIDTDDEEITDISPE